MFGAKKDKEEVLAETETAKPEAVKEEVLAETAKPDAVKEEVLAETAVEVNGPSAMPETVKE